MTRRLVAAMAVAGLVLMSCSSDDTTSDESPATTEQTAEPEVTAPEPEATEPEPAVTEPDVAEPEPAVTEPDVTEPEPAVTEPAHSLEMAGCEQVAIYYSIDAATAEERVPADVQLAVENGQVTSLFIANDCADTAVDGVASGPARVHAQWLAVPGPDEEREGPQFEGAPVLPTAYWEPIFTATNNPTLEEMMRAADLDIQLVDSIRVDVANLDISPEMDGYLGHSGSVTNGDPLIDYTWITMNPFAAAEEIPYGDQVTGFVHVVGDLELEAVGTIRVADVPGCGVGSGVDPDDEGQTPDLPDGPISSTPGTPATGCFLVAYDDLTFETRY